MMRRFVVAGAMVTTMMLIFGAPYFAQDGAGGGPAAGARRNVIIFVADGLRNGSVNEMDAPTLSMIRKQGVYFLNSHSLFPTFTTANASAIATGHFLGDTGDFSNTIWVGYPTFEGMSFGNAARTPVPFLENDQILSDVASHYGGNYLGETTLLTAAIRAGDNVASIGKLGPAAIQELELIAASAGRFPVSASAVVLDDATGTSAGVPLPAGISAGLAAAGLSTDAPARTNGYAVTSTWNNGAVGARRANIVQQQWFADAATRVVLPAFAKDSTKPFVMLFWSRDPDGTQHNQGDSTGTLFPGINGDTSKQAVRNADNNLRQLMDWLDANPSMKATTDVFVTSDHGFATISKREISRTGRVTSAESAKHYYLDANGAVDTALGFLPPGFLAIDLALGMNTNLFDPDVRTAAGVPGPFRQVRLRPEYFERPLNGSGLLGDSVLKTDGSDARAIVAANGGSDLIYVPDKNPDTVKHIVGILTGLDYVGGIFVDDQYGKIDGALPMSAISLVGSSALPRPAIAVAFKVFYLNPGDLQSGVQVSDSTLGEGQGMHGGIGRESTFNNMAAIGPDFKAGYVDDAPMGNGDIVPTLAEILGLKIAAHGKLTGRVIEEALRSGGTSAPTVNSAHLASGAVNGQRTILEFQRIGDETYVDRGCFVEAMSGDAKCP